MNLPKGAKLGPYEIQALIGEGGMGHVYRAIDLRLNRVVAIKVLPPHFTDNAEMKERFEREAQTIAALNHPHICTLYDVGREDGAMYLVMEFIDGETLADRLERGPLPLEEALRVGIEIADALEKAHRQGVIHRDLKPANIMFTRSSAKLLDFGLAKLNPLATTSAAGSALATNMSVTVQGAILGTMQYMAPEQLEGREADSRTDIFAFGAVLYEVVSGKRAFEGRSQASLISSIMTAGPQPMAPQLPAVPAVVEHLIRVCLRKEPDERWQNFHDLKLQLQWLAAGGWKVEPAAPVTHQSLPRRRSLLPWALLAVAALAASAMAVPAYLYLRSAPSAAQIRFDVDAPGMRNSFFMSISPDGRQVAFVGSTEAGDTALFVRPLDSTVVTQLPGTANAGAVPFWSPNSRSIAFGAGGKLRRIDVETLSSQDITTFPATSGAWNEDDVILFSARNVLYQVSASGGEPLQVTTLAQGETGHFAPHFLPGGRRFLYTVWSNQQSSNGIYAGSLDSKETTRLIPASSMAAFAAPGYLFYQREAVLLAQRFDPASSTLSGNPVPVADGLPLVGGLGRAAFSASQTGTLIYRPARTPVRRFVWFDRGGMETEIGVEPRAYTENFDLSADGRQVAVSIAEGGSRSDVWTIDLERGVASRLTYDERGSAGGRDTVWSPDGSLIAFSSYANGPADISLKRANGLGPEDVLVSSSNPEYVEDWSADGRYLIYGTWAPTPTDFWAVALTGDRKPFPFLQSPFRKDEPHFSPDGTWVAYTSDESGRWEIYVVSFPKADQKRSISKNGGTQPRWRRDGKELFYLAPDGQLMAVDVTTSAASVQSGIPRALFDTRIPMNPTVDQYDAAANGQRFLMLKTVGGATSDPIRVVVNWPALLK